MTTAKTTLFVAGATGYTGREVVRLAVTLGARTLAHVRPDSPKREEWLKTFADMGAEVDCTPWDRLAMTRRLTELEPTHVYALLGTTRKRAAEARKQGIDASYHAVDHGLTALLLGSALDVAPAPRFIYLSSMGAGGSSRSRYMQARTACETDIRKSGLPYTIVRPSFIVGPDRDAPRPGERIGAGLIDGALNVAAWMGARRFSSRYRSISNTALARALITHGLSPREEGYIVEADQIPR